jgi:hypothetical protein
LKSIEEAARAFVGEAVECDAIRMIGGPASYSYFLLTADDYQEAWINGYHAAMTEVFGKKEFDKAVITYWLSMTHLKDESREYE